MIDLKKHRNLERYAFIALISFIVILFLASIIINFRDSTSSVKNTKGDAIAAYALQYLQDEKLMQRGKSLDCSGFTCQVYEHFSVDLPPTALEQWRKYGVSSSAKPGKGDLVFFATTGHEVSHVGIYIGEGKFLHSPGRGKKVKVESLSNSYFKKGFISVGKVNFESR